MISNTVIESDETLFKKIEFDMHPLRDKLYDEFHSRPSPIIQSPCYISHISFHVNDNERDKEYQSVVAMTEEFNIKPPSTGDSCFYHNFGNFSIRWERHLEFSTYTFIRNIDDAESSVCLKKDQLFVNNALNILPTELLKSLPGRLLTAVHLTVLNGSNTISTISVQKSFDGERLFGSKVADNEAQVYTTFRAHKDGFSRVLIQNRGLNNYQTGRLIQRVLDIETYRIVSLLALPVVRKIGPVLRKMERQLVLANQEIASKETGLDDNVVLNELSDLASKAEEYLSEISYRIGATNGYFDLVNSRLDGLAEKQILGLSTFREFIDTRLAPGIKTCNAVQLRMERLSSRIAQASSLLRTRIELSIATQNQKLLESMNTRSRIQLRLQQTVEGVSVVAIAYYLIGLLEYIYVAVIAIGLNLNLKIALGISSPIVLALSWFAVRNVIRSIKKTKNTD